MNRTRFFAILLSLFALLHPRVPAQQLTQTIDNVDDLLTAIEAVDHDIDSLTASVIYQRMFALQRDRHTRYGSLAYLSADNPNSAAMQEAGFDDRRAFALTFNRIVVDDTQRTQDQTIVFDGQWLVEREIDEDGKRFTKRRIARPGQAFDPFRVGNQTLIPLPIGQRKDDILARYNAELLAPNDGVDPNNPFLAGLSRTYQLRLTPLDPNNEEERFKEIRLWYQQGSLLPALSIAVHRNSDESLVRLTSLKLNQPIDPELLSVDEPRDDGWQVRIEDRLLDGPIVEDAPEDGPLP